VNIAFFGSPSTARIVLESILRSGFNVPLIFTQPDRPAGRGKKTKTSAVKNFALEFNLPLLQPRRIRKDAEALDTLKRVRPDLNVVVAYGQIMPSSVIYLPEFNSVNLHFSLLPKYRGAAPVQWAIKNGADITGVTVFVLDEKMDEGPILSQEQVSIQPGENAQELEERLAHIGADLLVDTIRKIRELNPESQDHSLATYAPLIKKEDGRIDWNQSAAEIDRHVRAFWPWPSTFSFLEMKRIKILKGSVLPDESYPGQKPGRIVAVQTAGIDVCCGDGLIYRIERLQPENKPAMPAHAFSAGARLQPGAAFRANLS
jgi:methionyl-tRNA formyltransferase